MAQALTEVGVSGLAIMDFDAKQGKAAAKELRSQTGVDVRFYRLDVTNETAVEEAVADVAAHFGRIDTLISSAGVAK